MTAQPRLLGTITPTVDTRSGFGDIDRAPRPAHFGHLLDAIAALPALAVPRPATGDAGPPRPGRRGAAVGRLHHRQQGAARPPPPR
jgi:hypothetical protein